MEGGESMSNKNIRIMQMVAVLIINNAFILLAVADIDFLNIALYGGWFLIIVAGIYLARATEEMVDDFNTRYQEQESRRR
jgi:hypothetical protein